MGCLSSGQKAKSFLEIISSRMSHNFCATCSGSLSPNSHHHDTLSRLCHKHICGAHIYTYNDTHTYVYITMKKIIWCCIGVTEVPISKLITGITY